MSISGRMGRISSIVIRVASRDWWALRRSNILDVKVAAGASVKAGDVLVILEAMKMENEIVAPQDGTVASVNVNKGDTVNSGDVLVSMN